MKKILLLLPFLLLGLWGFSVGGENLGKQAEQLYSEGKYADAAMSGLE